MNHLQEYFRKNPVIAGLRNKEDLEEAVKSNCIALFVLYGDILVLPEIMEKAREFDKLVFLHIDLIEGIGKDKKGIKYLAENNLCDGIVTTKNNLINVAQKEGLIAIQRLFLIDSAALSTGDQLLQKSLPDAVEILPGIAAPYFIDKIKNKMNCPIIAGGLINLKEEVEMLLGKGVYAVSTSNHELWHW